MNVKGHGGSEDPNTFYCYFHPKHFVIGVCPFCLNDRLLVLAAQQSRRRNRFSSSSTSSPSSSSSSSAAPAKPKPSLLHRHRRTVSASNNKLVTETKKPPLNLHKIPKIFALSSLLNRLEFRHWKPADVSDDNFDACSSPEDSFISIKIEDNGVASWEKGTVSKVSLDHCSMAWNSSKEPNNKSMIEHAKQPRATSLRWRKRIGHLFQLVRWKRSNKASVCHVGAKVDGVKVRKSWIRNLTKREGPKNNI